MSDDETKEKCDETIKKATIYGKVEAYCVTATAIAEEIDLDMLDEIIMVGMKKLGANPSLDDFPHRILTTLRPFVATVQKKGGSKK